jgi:hypothetical protein
MARNQTGELVQGTLDMMILKTLSRRPMPGYPIALAIYDRSREVCRGGGPFAIGRPAPSRKPKAWKRGVLNFGSTGIASFPITLSSAASLRRSILRIQHV